MMRFLVLEDGHHKGLVSTMLTSDSIARVNFLLKPTFVVDTMPLVFAGSAMHETWKVLTDIFGIGGHHGSFRLETLASTVFMHGYKAGRPEARLPFGGFRGEKADVLDLTLRKPEHLFLKTLLAFEQLYQYPQRLLPLLEEIRMLGYRCGQRQRSIFSKQKLTALKFPDTETFRRAARFAVEKNIPVDAPGMCTLIVTETDKQLFSNFTFEEQRVADPEEVPPEELNKSRRERRRPEPI